MAKINLQKAIEALLLSPLGCSKEVEIEGDTYTICEDHLLYIGSHEGVFQIVGVYPTNDNAHMYLIVKPLRILNFMFNSYGNDEYLNEWRFSFDEKIFDSIEEARVHAIKSVSRIVVDDDSYEDIDEDDNDDGEEDEDSQE